MLEYLKARARSRRWYRALQTIFYGMRGAVEAHIVGTRFQTWLWRRRSGDVAQQFVDSLDHPHRAMLADRVAAYSPLRQVLEFGCNSGANLHVLARRLPNAQLVGLDISERAIAAGQREFAARGFDGVGLRVGTIAHLAEFATNSVDVAFTDAVLLYIGPDQVHDLVRELLRVARTAVMFNEWHFDRTAPKAREWRYYYGHWVYDFRALVARHSPDARITITKIPAHVWSGTGWEQFGSIIEIVP